MKVKELVERLQKCDPEALVSICEWNDYSQYFAEIDVCEGTTNPDEIYWEHEPSPEIPKVPFKSVSLEIL